MKLRASYGTLGNDQIPNNGYVSQLSGEATYVLMVLWLTGTVKYKSNLKWEQAQKFDLGLDLKLFNNKVSIVTDYFTDTRKDLLIPNIPVSGITGNYAQELVHLQLMLEQ
jgi:hypothetical protein